MWTKEGKRDTSPQFSTLGFLMRGTWWGALAALGMAFFFTTLGFVYELIASFAYLRYWIAEALDLAFFQVTLASMLGAAQGFIVAAFLRVSEPRRRISTLVGILAGGVIGAVGGLFFIVIQLILSIEGYCPDILCWISGIVQYVGIPTAVGCWVGWRLVRYIQTTTRHQDTAPQVEPTQHM